MSHTDQFIQLIIIAVAGFAVVMQAVILLLIFFALKKAVSALQSEVSELRVAVVPILRNSQDFLARVAPKIEATTADVAELVHGVKERLATVESTTGVVMERLERQTLRVDTMLTGTLDSLERAGIFVATAVNKPLRQVAGIVTAIRAAVETLRAPAPAPAEPGVAYAEPTVAYTPDEYDHSL